MKNPLLGASGSCQGLLVLQVKIFEPVSSQFSCSFFQDIKHGGTPLHWAKSKEMVVALIEHGCAVDARNFNGKTALHVAVEYERLECAVALASHGAGVDEPDAEGNTALHMAVAQGSVAVVRALVVFDAATKATNAVSLTFQGYFWLEIFLTSSLQEGLTPWELAEKKADESNMMDFKDREGVLYSLFAIGAVTGNSDPTEKEGRSKEFKKIKKSLTPQHR